MTTIQDDRYPHHERRWPTGRRPSRRCFGPRGHGSPPPTRAQSLRVFAHSLGACILFAASGCASPTEPGTVLRADGVVLLSRVDDFVDQFEWSADGTEIVYLSRPWGRERDGALHAVSLETGQKRLVVPAPDGGWLGRFQVARDTWIYYGVFWNHAPGKTHLRRIRGDGSEDEAIAEGHFHRWAVAPDGRTILIADTAQKLMAIDVASGQTFPVAEDVTPLVAGGGIHWSPDGTRVAVVQHAPNDQIERLLFEWPVVDIDRRRFSYFAPVWTGEAQLVWPNPREPFWAFGYPRGFGLLALESGRWEALPPPLTFDYPGTVRFHRDGNWFVYVAWECGAERRALFETECTRSDYSIHRRLSTGGPTEVVASYSQSGYGFAGGHGAPFLSPDGSSLIYELDGDLRLVALK